ncbi:MAG: hypothetical protein ABII89_01980 [Candidatus Omnitrophota bacterium]
MNKKTVFLAVLLLFSLGFLFFSLRLAGKKPIQAKIEPGITEVINEEDFWEETADLLEKSKSVNLPIYYHATKRDPMQPVLASAGAGSSQPFQLIIKGTPYSLTGTMVGPNKASAIIDEKIYRVGDTLNDKKIIAIERDRVILKKGTDEEVLRLGN